MLSEEKAMEILEAYDLTWIRFDRPLPCAASTTRPSLALWWRCALAAGLDPAPGLGRPVITEPFADKITEWIDRSSGRVRVDVVLNRPGFLGDSIPWKRGWSHVRSTEADPPELRERAVRMVLEARAADPNVTRAITRISEQLGVGPNRCATR